MSGSGRLQSDPLFQGLTRPTMIAGVSFMYFVCNALFNIIAFINTSNFIFILVAAPTIHMIGRYICRKEPRAVEMLILKAGKGCRCVNKNFHGRRNSYII
jgi:type IV secretion system protein VirB3